jgi:hypothetical protein
LWRRWALPVFAAGWRGEPGARERDVAKQSTFTNKNGATITRNVDFERDRDMHTWMKDVTVEHVKGE